MSKCRFIKAGAILGAAATVSVAYAGDVTRVDFNFVGVDYWSGDQGSFDPASPNYSGQTSTGHEAGRAFDGVGCSNADVSVCWNTGSAYENWASECSLALTMSDGTPEGEGWYGPLASVFPGQDTGPAAEGTCEQFLAPDEAATLFTPLTWFCPASGDVSMAVYSVWNDGTTLRAGTATVDTFFELSAPPPPGCVDATGGCAEVHSNPGCDDASCCALVCDPSVGGDPFCCDPGGTWDSTCVDLAIALCGFFIYECETTGASPPNDCVTSASAASNGTVYSFNTTNANTDGPDEVGCNSAEEDFPIWNDVWYVIEVAADSVVTATCCLTAEFDTKIALYNGGPIGTTYNPETLPDDFLACNEDCDDPTFFSSELVFAVVGGNQYFVRLGGYLQAVGTGDIRIDWAEPEPPIDPQTCDNPGLNPVTQSDDPNIDAGGVACAAGGITVENAYARVYEKSELNGGGSYAINCVNFGRTNSGSYIPGVVNFYRDVDGADPGSDQLELMASVPVGLHPTEGANEMDTVVLNLAVPLCVDLADGESLVVELQYAASTDGFVTYAGSGTDNTPGSETWIRSGACGVTEYITMESIGFPDSQWYVELSGTNDCSSDPGCPGDFNDDGQVDGADFGSVLAAWGTCPSPCPQDLNNDGQVNGADIGLMLSYWGTCTP
jgi:hypothetical protein